MLLLMRHVPSEVCPHDQHCLRSLHKLLASQAFSSSHESAVRVSCTKNRWKFDPRPGHITVVIWPWNAFFTHLPIPSVRLRKCLLLSYGNVCYWVTEMTVTELRKWLLLSYGNVCYWVTEMSVTELQKWLLLSYGNDCYWVTKITVTKLRKCLLLSNGNVCYWVTEMSVTELRKCL